MKRELILIVVLLAAATWCAAAGAQCPNGCNPLKYTPTRYRTVIDYDALERHQITRQAAHRFYLDCVRTNAARLQDSELIMDYYPRDSWDRAIADMAQKNARATMLRLGFWKEEVVKPELSPPVPVGKPEPIQQANK